jgi:hypothetical protein
MTNPLCAPARRPDGKTFATLFAALFWLVLASTAAIPPAEKLLPDDTLIMMSVPDFVKLREIYKTSPQGQLWNDPAMKPFKDKFISRWKEEFVQPLEHDLGVSFDDYTSLPQGQLTFAMTQNGWQGEDDPVPGLLLLLDTKNKSDQLKKNLADLRKKWVDAGKPIKTEKIRDIEFSVLPLSGKDVPKTLKRFIGDENQSSQDEATNVPPKDGLFIGQFESLLIVGNSVSAVEKVAGRLTGGSTPILGDLGAYEANRLSLFRDAPFYGWVNVKSFIDIINRKSSEKDDSETPNPFALPKPDKITAATGLSGLKTLAFSIQNPSEGSLFQFFAGVPESSRQGIFKIFPAEKDSGPPPFVPADAVKFQRWRLDGQKAWATLEKMINDISPQWLNTLNFVLDTANAAAKEKDPAFDIRKNLIGNLGDDIIIYQKAPRGSTPAELASPPALFLLGSPNPEQLAGALKSIMALKGQQSGSPAEREFLGRKIYSVPLPSVPLPIANVSPSAPGTLSYAASGGYVALTTDASMLEEYLRSNESRQKPLRESSGLIEAMQKVGGSSTGLFGYENQAETMRAIVEVLRKTPPATTNTSLSSPYTIPFSSQGINIREWMDYSLLPPYEKIAKYFNFSVFSGDANVDGVTFKLFTPVPPQLKK